MAFQRPVLLEQLMPPLYRSFAPPLVGARFSREVDAALRGPYGRLAQLPYAAANRLTQGYSSRSSRLSSSPKNSG